MNIKQKNSHERVREFLLSVILVLVLLAFSQTALAVCGDGVLQNPAEQCDDGNLDVGDCCDDACEFEVVDTPCGVGDLCFGTAAVCDGLGACVPQPDCPLFGGLSGFDSYSVNLRDRGTPESARLRFAQKRIYGGFGQPDIDTRYALCVYEGAPEFEVSRVLVSSELDTGSSWRQKANGAWKYTHKNPAPGGVRRALLTTKAPRGLMRIRAAGERLRLPGPANASAYFVSPVTVGLVSDAPGCWGATVPVGTAAKNTASQFKAKRPVTD